MTGEARKPGFFAGRTVEHEFVDHASSLEGFKFNAHRRVTHIKDTRGLVLRQDRVKDY
jgi:hypothetical protein